MATKPKLLPVATARARILAGVKPSGKEVVALAEAAGRVLADDLKAKRDQPPFAASAMDGYAVRSEDVQRVPVTLRLAGQSAAGKRYGKKLKAGEAVRIFTGAPVPSGADCIVVQESTTATDAGVTVHSATQPGRYVRPAALDFRRDAVVLEQGTRLRARHIAVAASANAARVTVRRKPVIALIGTGSELVLPGGRPGPDQIVSSNNASLSAAIDSFGGSVLDLGIVEDDVRVISGAIRRAAGADVLVTIGGASVGEHDLVQEALAANGIRLDFWRIAMRPGKPLMFARKGRQRIIGLPGNPVSALVCARIYLKPLIDALLGTTEPDTYLEARLGEALGANDERQDYLRATYIQADDGSITVAPYSRQDSSMQSVMAHSNCLILRAPDARPARKGSKVLILPLDF